METAAESDKPAKLRQIIDDSKGFVFDLDGTIYLGENLIPGADRAVEWLRSVGKRVAFLSNKPIATRESYAKKLNKLGISCETESVINSSLVCARYLQKHKPGAWVFPVGEQPLIDDLDRHGLRITKDPERVEVVVVSFDRTFNYRKLDTAYRAAVNGADLIATNPDRTCPMPGYELPDSACMIAAIEACAERKVEPIVGKPSPIMLKEVTDVLGLEPEECVMVGDRSETDLVMARRTGMKFLLVLSGVTDASDLDSLPEEPDLVLDSVGELAED